VVEARRRGARYCLTYHSDIRGIRGAWLYVAGHGRYILSLTPRAELGFVKAGEVRGGLITFTLANDQFKVECPNAIAPGYAPYMLYVLRDPEWTPTATAQSGRALVGSVAPAEIVSLKRK
jgi:hypothetical protein